LGEWNAWWNTTIWRKEHSDSSINFDKSTLKSVAWEYIKPCARFHDGLLSVQYERCEVVLVHPAVKDTGTSVLARHSKSEECKKQAKRKGKEDIKLFIEKKKVRITSRL
jgi:hypothetical protein